MLRILSILPIFGPSCVLYAVKPFPFLQDEKLLLRIRELPDHNDEMARFGRKKERALSQLEECTGESTRFRII
jgi:hypothetical protein